jgi:hypothetical protein
MGAWHFIEPYLEWVLNQIHAPNKRPRYAGRAASAATATGLDVEASWRSSRPAWTTRWADFELVMPRAVRAHRYIGDAWIGAAMRSRPMTAMSALRKTP